MEKSKQFLRTHKKWVLVLIVVFLFALFGGLYAAFGRRPDVQGVETGTAQATSEAQPTISGIPAPTESPVVPQGAAPQQTSPAEPSQPAQNAAQNAATPANDSAPTHQHTWQDHTATRWVSHIVTIVDTPERVVQGAQLYTEQPDGTWISNGKTYWFENGFTMDDFKEILIDKIKNEGYIGNYVNRKKTVPAKTHTEDQGHSETYVDYQFCNCGATRTP